MESEDKLKLEEHRDRYELIIQGINDAIWDWDIKNKRVYFSPRWCEMRGLEPDQLKGIEEEWSSGIHPEDYPHVMSALQDHFNKKAEYFFAEYRIRLADGSWKWILDRGAAQWDESGEVLRMAGAETDITVQKEAQLKLAESERRLSSIIGNLSGLVYQCGVEAPWQITFIGGSYRSITGYSSQEIMGPEVGSFSKLILSEDMPYVEHVVEQAVRKGCPYEVSYRIQTKHGDVRWVWERGRCVSINNEECGMLEGVIDDITELKNTELALKKSQERFNFALGCSHTGFWSFDLLSFRIQRNSEYEKIFGYKFPLQNWTYETFIEHLIPDDRARVDRMFRQAIDTKKGLDFECRIIRQDGAIRWVWVVGDHEVDVENTNKRIVGVVQDITDRKRSEEESARYNAELKSIFDALPDIYFRMMPDGTILDYQVQKAGELYTEPENFLGKRMQDVLPSNVGQLFQSKLDEIEQSGDMLAFGYELIVNNELRYYDARFNRISVNNQLVCVIRDISDIKKSEEELYRLAHQDTLTGLPNRLHMNEHLIYAIKRADRHKSHVAIIFFDLDNFKIINDSFGHDTGDELLKETANRLLKHVRDSDLVTRISGDEFIVIMEGVHHIEDIEVVVKKLLSEFKKDALVDGHSINITASMGVSLYPQDGSSPEELLRNADAAMYRAKELGRNTYQFYKKEMTANAIERVFVEQSLRQAFDRNEFFLNYQPQIDLCSHAIVGVEALIRWRHPKLGVVLPERFIPFAEETRLIIEIGEWVLRAACTQAKAWLDRGIPFGRISVNVSGPQIKQSGLLAMVKTILDETGLPACYLELEVTENYIMKQYDQAAEELLKIRELGVTLSIDDFGAGYSSLSYLKKLPIHKLKIDQGFIREIPRDSNDMAISKAIIAMGNSLGLTVIAEGVETQEQADVLLKVGCHEAQGFLYSEAVDCDVAEVFLSGKSDAMVVEAIEKSKK